MEKKQKLQKLFLSQQKAFNMKKTLILLFVIGYLVFVAQTFAVSPTITEKETSPTPDVINQLKDRIASRVAQLKLVERRGIIGVVENVSNTQITFIDVQGNTRFVDVDELTKFSSPKDTDSFGISDITKGTKIGALGLYNKESKRLLARFINVLTLPQFINGAVSEIDKENYVVKVIAKDKKQFDIDIEVTTKTYSYTKDSDLVKSGFSKIKPNTKIFVVGTTDVKNKDKIIALRMIHFPEMQMTIEPTSTPKPTKVIPEKTSTSTKSGEKKE